MKEEESDDSFVRIFLCVSLGSGDICLEIGIILG